MKLNVSDFKGVRGAKDAIECEGGVCNLPEGGGQIMLGQPFLVERDGKMWTVMYAVVLGHVMYYCEEIS